MLKTLLLTLALIIVSIGVVFAIQFSVPSDRTPLAPISVDSEDEEYDNQSWFDDFYADEGIIEQPVDTPDPPVVNDNGGNIVEKPPISGGDEPDPTAKTYTIEFTFNGCYSPANQSVKVGDKVVFVNSDSKKNMWPASNDHPSHDLYSGFDSGGNVAPGGNFSFTFTKKGNWGYHDHNKLSCGGIITVN